MTSLRPSDLGRGPYGRTFRLVTTIGPGVLVFVSSYFSKPIHLGMISIAIAVLCWLLWDTIRISAELKHNYLDDAEFMIGLTLQQHVHDGGTGFCAACRPAEIWPCVPFKRATELAGQSDKKKTKFGKEHMMDILAVRAVVDLGEMIQHAKEELERGTEPES